MDEQRFTWVPFYEELAKKLLEYKDRRRDLIVEIKKVYAECNLDINKLLRKAESQADIDPFSLFTEFNRSIKDETRSKICEAYKKVFLLNSDLPSDFSGIPVRNNLRRLFYTLPGDEKYNPKCFTILWGLFESALADDENRNNDDFNKWFDESLELNCVALPSLSMALFWIQPYRYVNLDKKNALHISSFLRIALKQKYSGFEYLDLCKSVISKATAEEPSIRLPELSLRAHNSFEKQLNPPNANGSVLSKERILKFLCDETVFTKECEKAIEWMYQQNGPVVFSQSQKDLFNAIIQLAKTIVETEPNYVWIVNPQKETDKVLNDLSILFQYIRINNQKPINCTWQMREELKQAYEEYLSLKEGKQPAIVNDVNNMKHPLNMILYGPPGTGKTYHTAIYAVAILTPNKTLDDVRKMPYEEVMEEYKKLKENGRIAFTTFHQSYGYEDFIEGIRPVITDGVEQDEKSIIYKIEPGVFKAFCDSVHESKDAKTQFSEAWAAMVESIQNNPDKPYIFTRKTGSTFNATLVNPDRLRVVWTSGTYNDLKEEKTYQQWLGEYDRSQLTGGNKWMYDAIQAVIDELIAKFNLPRKPTEPESQNRVFIIDEINRGNISKIFGELITLIEDTKRSGEPECIPVVLPYSQKPFSVPKNVYILGTMNTADRSIALLDTALRRRFVFKEMMPEPKLLDGLTIKGIEISEMLDRMNQRINVLYDREHTIGHAYFMSLRKIDDEDKRFEMLADIFRDRIIPLLQEYFYNDYEKIRLVLGDSKKGIANTTKFILTNNEKTDDTESIDIQSLFGETDSDYDYTDQVTYRINTKAFDEIDSYKKIL